MHSLTTSAFSEKPPVWVPPGITLQGGHFMETSKREYANLKPKSLNCWDVHSSVPGGVRWTMWSSVFVDGMGMMNVVCSAEFYSLYK